MIVRDIYVCIHCDCIYSEPVSQCDCMEGSGADFVRGYAVYDMPNKTGGTK
jgi:hypothetical protein